MLDVDARRVVISVLWGSLALGSAVGLAAVSAWLIARASQMPAVLDLSVAVVTVRALGISRGVMRYLERLSTHDVALRGVVNLRERVYATLADGRPDAVAGLRRGDVLARVGSDVDAVGDVVVRALVPALVAIVVSTGSVLLVAAFSPASAAVLAVALAIAGLASPQLATRAARRAELGTIDARADVAASTMTILDGAAELTVSGRLASAVETLRRAEARLAAMLDDAARPAAWAQGLGTLATGLAVVGALLIGIPATTAGTLAPVELAVIVLTPLAAFEATNALPGAAVQLVRSGGAAVRIMDLLDRAGSAVVPASAADVGHAVNVGHAVGEETEPVEPGGCGTRAGHALVPGSVVATGLSCGWPGRPPVVEGLDLVLEPGRAVVVVGPSGIGKSTLLLTLAGLIPPVAGTVLIDGVDSGDLPHGDAARTVTLTAEDAHVFDTSVLENLRVARGDVTPHEARAALRQAGLGDLLAGLPEGLETRLGADATALSGGERRRLLLARALLAPAPLMLLDEPGEHLDTDTADALLRDVLAVGRDRGVLVVTHRLAALEGADEVLVLGDEATVGTLSPRAGRSAGSTLVS